MVNHKEILRLKSLGLTHCEIADAAGCGRNTVTRTLARAREQKLNWQQVQSLSQQEVTQRLFPTEQQALSTKCRTTSGYTGKCRRVGSP